MKYLSIDIEATGLEVHDLLIEIALVPFCAKSKTIEKNLTFHHFIKCPSFEELKPKLNQWVVENNQPLINKAHTQGLPAQDIKTKLEQYLQSPAIKSYFSEQKKITLFGKSLSALDIPILHRTFGAEIIQKFFSHKTLDLTCVAFAAIDLERLPIEFESSSNLMKHFQMGEVAHTALEDALNTISLYFKLLKLF